MRELNDPENPYLEHYDDWDVWIYMHETSVLEAQGVENIWLDYPGWDTFYQRVDENGFVVPQLEGTRRWLEQLRGIDTDEEAASCTHSIQARGAMPWEMQRQMEQQEILLSAKYMPAIPEWLVDGPPQWAMLLPDGDVVTYGQVGQGDILRQNMTGEELACYRYSADGDLLSWTEPGQEWWQLYFDFDAVLEQYGVDNIYWYEDNGFVVISDPESWETTAVFDYDGTRLPNDHPLRDPERDGTRFLKIEGSDLMELYAVQQSAEGRSI